MNLTSYQSLATRTAKKIDQQTDLTHAALGLAGEAGEFADLIKKTVFYRKPLDRNHAIEELGDILWYVAAACEALGIDMGAVAHQNIEKLRRRYPTGYSDDLAVARLDKAR